MVPVPHRLLTLGLTLALLMVTAACAGRGAATSSRIEEGEAALQSEPVVVTEAETTTTDSTTTTAPGPDRAELVLASMTVEEKVGQLFMPVLSGSDATTVSVVEARNNLEIFGYETPAEIVTAFKLGGVIYLGQNILTADQVGTLSAELQRAARDDSGVGLLVAVDQEGGRVNRITDGVTVFPPAALLSGDSAAVEEAGYLTGRQVAAQGVNVVLAPVADITAPGTSGAIGNRSYGDDPEVVAEMVRAAVEGLEASGVAAAVKHWPGHGATEVDSHVRLPVLDISEEEWRQRERVPFVAAIEEDVSIVLVGHLVLPAVDPGRDPASVSPVLIEEILRDELGYDGVVMTDALNMGAVGGFDGAQLVVDSLAAGADIMLVPPDLPAAYAAVLDAVASGQLPIERIDESVLRVLRLKWELGLLPTDEG